MSFLEDTVQAESCFVRLVCLFVVLDDPFSTPNARRSSCVYCCAALDSGCGKTSGIISRPIASEKIAPMSIAAAVFGSNFPVAIPFRLSAVR